MKLGCLQVWFVCQIAPDCVMVYFFPEPFSLLISRAVDSGVLNVVSGYGSDAGAALASHPSLRKLDITGGTATGAFQQLAVLFDVEWCRKIACVAYLMPVNLSVRFAFTIGCGLQAGLLPLRLQRI